jgi:hypothetical protein
MYYETLSVFPVYIYKILIKRGAEVFVHYHEYTSLKEYESGMQLVKYFHKLERLFYQKCHWISHTNSLRMDLFIEDESIKRTDMLRILPNYPPSSWRKNRNEGKRRDIRFVYVGALSVSTMYLKEFVDWILSKDEYGSLDIYSTNMSEETIHYLSSVQSERIRVLGGVEYFNLPSVLVKYDIGLILYKGHIPNYIFNAPNKLFEYLACGLDVWFPDVMVGCKPYQTEGKYPQLVPTRFEALFEMDFASTIDRRGLDPNPFLYSAEDAYMELLHEIEKKNGKSQVND